MQHLVLDPPFLVLLALDRQLLAKCGVFAERDRIGKSRLGAMESSERAVHVGAARHHDAPGVPPEGAHERATVVPRQRHHVHDDVGMERTQFVPECAPKVRLVTMNVGDRRWQLRFVLATMEHEYVVAVVDERADEERSTELRAANDEDAH